MNSDRGSTLAVETDDAGVVKPDDATVNRRTFLFKVAIAINAVIGLMVATPVVRFLLSPLRGKGGYQSWIPLGKITDYEPGTTILATYRNPYANSWDGETANVACYVRRQPDGGFTVFAVNCAHLGCPVRWFPQSQLFLCPCHGGAYYADGSRAAGPPERGLFTYASRVDGDTLMIEAGQLPTLANEARLESPGDCPGRLSAGKTDSQLVRGILPCPKPPSAGTNEPTIG
jgi:menaquinol-cytochrome c reductase iron-sulfur subunit